MVPFEQSSNKQQTKTLANQLIGDGGVNEDKVAGDYHDEDYDHYDDVFVDDDDEGVVNVGEQEHYPWLHAHKFHTPFTFGKTLNR